MQYRELRDFLNRIPNESVELDQDVTVYLEDCDEFVGVYGEIKVQREDDVLDVGHIYLTMSSEAVIE